MRKYSKTRNVIKVAPILVLLLELQLTIVIMLSFNWI